MTTVLSSCAKCANYIQASICLAFPDGIPDEIWFDENDHHKPHPDDNGIKFESVEED